MPEAILKLKRDSIDEALKAKGFNTIGNLAQAAGVHRATLSAAYNGGPVSGNLLAALVIATGIPINFLVRVTTR